MAAKRGTSGINGLIAVDKPIGMTSHDVVNVVRRVMGERRVGHTGTLDPAASGVMLIGIGQAARLSNYITAQDKEYIAQISFGFSTVTDDAEGEMAQKATPTQLEGSKRLEDESFAREYLESLVGESQQIPPQYSAIQKDGKRAYAVARSGGEVVLDSRTIRIDRAELISIGKDEHDNVYWDVNFGVSKGTYIRSIARDCGVDLDCPAHLTQLRRTRNGFVSLGNCVSLDVLRESSTPLEYLVDPVSCLGLPTVELSEKEHKHVTTGNPLKAMNEIIEGHVLLVYDKMIMAIAHHERGYYRMDAVFPDGVSRGNMNK